MVYIFTKHDTASENMWHFIMLSENIYHISQKNEKITFLFNFIIKENGNESPCLLPTAIEQRAVIYA
jgi:hypothetical protein